MEKRNLYFQHSDGRLSLVAENIAEEDVCSTITEFVKQLNPNFKIYYFNVHHDNPRIYDCGSHTEFFYWGEYRKDAWE